MTKKYCVVNTMDVKSIMNGGRLFDAKNDEVKHNGVLGYVGELQEGELHIRDFHLATDDSIKKQLPMIVAQAEVMYDNARRSQSMLGNYEIHAGQAFNVVPLSINDTIEVSEDLIKGSDITVGSAIKQLVGGGLEKVASAPASTEAMAYFKVVAVRESFIGQKPFGDGVVTAPAPKMFALELVLTA